jgi:DNA-binding NarL/FixJ family response regulator
MLRLRILLVDDHEMVRAGLKALIHFEPDFEVTGEASDVEAALECVRCYEFDVVVIDLSMPAGGGLPTTRRLKLLRPGLAIVSLTRHDEKAFLQGALGAGALGYVLKQSPYAELAAQFGRQPSAYGTLTPY